MTAVAGRILFACLCVNHEANAWTRSSQGSSRRQWLVSTVHGVTGAVTVGFTVIQHPPVASANDELPSFLRPLTKLAPLGSPLTFSNKSLNLTLDEIAARLTHDLMEGSTNQGAYFLTGDLSPDIFRDDCTFIDPNNQVSSLSQYQQALRILFDPAQSQVRIIKPLVVDIEARTITGTIRSRGVLQFPWHPQISSYESTITYTVGDDGLISRQSQTWTKSASDAIRESFTPSLFTPAPKSTLQASPEEPLEVTQLFEYINGRRPTDYSQEERFEIAQLIDSVVERRYSWKREQLPGKWMLVYLQPGPEGGGIDRRIPFPEFPFNDSYQIFTSDHITNVGELFGPLLEVQVSGGLTEVDTNNLETPKRFVANINEGKICWKETSCIPLPISGEGLFDGMYLGERLRIGQNLNGGGARVVQVRMA